MYGMSAKDRMSLFEKKSSGSDTKKTSSAPKKIGKLNIGNKKEAEKQPLNKPLAKKLDTKKDKEEQEKKAEEKKAEEKKVEAKKAEEKKEEVKKTEETKVEEKKWNKPDAKKLEEKKAEEKKAEEKKAEEKKALEKKAEEKKAEEKKAELKKAEEKKAEEKKAEERKAELKKAEEKKALEKKAEEKKAEEKKAELKKAEEKKAEEKKAEERKAELKKAEEKKAEEKKAEERKAELKKAEEKKAEEKKAEERKAELKKAEEKKAEERKAELKKAEEKKAEEKKEEQKKAEEKILAEKKEQEKKMEKSAPPKAAEKKEEPKPEIKKPEAKDVGAAKPKDVKRPNTLKPASADDLDLDSELEANLGVVSDVELQSPVGKTEVATVKEAKPAEQQQKPAEQQQKPAEVRKPAEQQQKPAEVRKPAEQQQKPAEVRKPAEQQQKPAEVRKPVEQQQKPAEVKRPAEQQQKPAEVKRQVEPQAKVAVENIPPTNLELKPKTVAPPATPAAKVEQLPKAEVSLKAKPSTDSKTPQSRPQTEVSVTTKPEPAKVKEVAPKQQNAEDQEVSAILDAALKQEPKKDEAPKKKESVLPKVEFKPLPEEFYNTIFYFSGMGTVVGSALAEGVYVAENTARISLDDEVVQNAKKEKVKSEADKEAVIKTARVQASDISVELKHLQNLLDSLPTFLESDINAQQVTRATDRAIHGSHYPPPQRRDPASWVKRPPQQQQQQNAIPTWKQQVQDGMAMMGHQPPGQKAHPGVQAQPFVPPQLKGKEPTEEASKKPAVVPQPKIEPAPPKEERPRLVEPAKVDQTDAAKVDQTEKDRVQPAPAPQVYAPPPPPPPLPSKPAGGVAVLPTAPPKAPVAVPSAVHKPGAVRPEQDDVRPPTEFLVRVAGKDQPDQAGGGRPRELGVHTADARVPSQPWQERYGKKKVDELPQPRPFGGAIQPRGLKTWQLSRLRTLEAQGFDVKQPEDFETYAHIKSSQSEENLPSLAPYLVSGRSKDEDFRRLAGEVPETGPKPFTPVNASSYQPASPVYKPKSKSISTPGFRSVTAPLSAPKGFQPTVNGTLPYCDL